MCDQCDKIVAIGGNGLDLLIEADSEARQRRTDYTPQQHTMDMASSIMDGYEAHSDQERAVQELAVTLAVALSRLIALQEIYGVTV